MVDGYAVVVDGVVVRESLIEKMVDYDLIDGLK